MTFAIVEPSLIASWKRVYLKEGAVGLNKNAGRPSKMHNSNPIQGGIEFLEKEYEYLKIEVTYLKKLKALGLKDPRENSKQE